MAEVIFQTEVFAGVPAVNDALEVFSAVLVERGEPSPGEEGSAPR